MFGELRRFVCNQQTGAPKALRAFASLLLAFNSPSGQQSARHCRTPLTTEHYKITPILPHFGAEVRGISLNGSEPLSLELVQRIKDDMTKYRVLVFKEQGRLPGIRQVELSRQLGEVESTFAQHPQSPHPDIFRVSNDGKEGCTGVGRSGWHIDGTFQSKPFKYQTMHFHSVCEGGETWFVPLKEFYELQDDATKARWNRYWMITRNTQIAHPMVYVHPSRGDTTMMFHCGAPFCAGWAVEDLGAEGARWQIKEFVRPEVIQAELTQRLDAAIDSIGFRMKWEVGDFAINDNLGNCHYAPPGTQNPRKQSGLRILHRTTIAGETTPMKADGRESFLIG